MANTSYLCATNKKTTYPSFVDPNFDPDEQTAACDVWCVPLLWAALFRPDDIVRKTFTPDGTEVVTEAPLATKAKVRKQLKAAVPYLNKLFAAEGKLDEYAKLLDEAVGDIEQKYITIEMEEIACLSDPPQAYYDTFRQALAGIGTDLSPEAKARFVAIAQLKAGRRFPPVRLLLDGGDAPDDDVWNHCRIVGASHERPVPWEPGGADEDGGGDPPLIAAVVAEDVDRVRKLLAAGAALDAEDNVGGTAIQYAAGRSPEIVELLLAAGATVAPGAVYSAVNLQTAAVVERLLRAGGDANDYDDFDDHTAVQRACYAPKEDVAKVKLLVTAGADVNWRDKQGRNALMTAAFARAGDVLAYLLSLGPDRATAAEALEFARTTKHVRWPHVSVPLFEAYLAGC